VGKGTNKQRVHNQSKGHIGHTHRPLATQIYCSAFSWGASLLFHFQLGRTCPDRQGTSNSFRPWQHSEFRYHSYYALRGRYNKSPAMVNKSPAMVNK